MSHTINPPPPPPPPVPARFFDGRTPRAAGVFLRFASDGTLLVLAAAPKDPDAPPAETGAGGTPLLCIPRAGVTIDSRLAGANRFVRLPGDAVCEVAGEHTTLLDTALAAWDRPQDAVTAAGAAPAIGNFTSRRLFLHRLENNWRLALAATALLAAAAAALLFHGMPRAARALAFALPDGIMNLIGSHTLETLDRIAFEPSEIPSDRQRQLHERFDAFLRAIATAPSRVGPSRPVPSATAPSGVGGIATASASVVASSVAAGGSAGGSGARRIVFRSAPRIGANAFALPSGDIVLTDDLVHLAAGDDELLAVLAHECGHVEARHAVRSVIQASFLTLLISFAAGDVTAATTIGGALPAFLLENRFSRDFEREADAIAVRHLKTTGLSPLLLGDILARLETAAAASAAAASDTDDSTDTADGDAGNNATVTSGTAAAPARSAWTAYLGTHPDTGERIRAIREAAAVP
ncbi:MAG: M48 family metallopeptidase [Opitutaceae bacterium]|jgi:Zn-dependent protease with chaperone function|nr:M48 family metallopeptidase [Opitutaceae bacterium]